MVRVKKGGYTCHPVKGIIRIVDEYHVRTFLLEIIISVIHHRYIRRIAVSFIVFFLKAAVRIFTIIWYGDYNSIHILVLIRRSPDAFKGIPHTHLVRQKNNLLSVIRHFNPYILFKLCQLNPDSFQQPFIQTLI
ncbi:hypothetical protein [Enterocloster clostridioformis]|uniref:hypothetical protein n=1 Tax=Enterocloster clostridioformis TaxID=1531 RepID=UPI0022E4BD98|nr:hypothetical protein [Enterocloster clostridioformis]